MTTHEKRSGLLGTVLVAVLAVGCSSTAGAQQEPDPDSRTSSPGAGPIVNGDELRSGGAGMGAAIHYGRVREARMLADVEAVDLALVGKVAGYETAQLEDCGRGLVMFVTPTDNIVGRPHPTQPVEVLLLWHGGGAGERLSEALPIGSPVVLYMNTVDDCRPSGEHFVPVSPQGFITEDDRGSIFPYDAGLNTAAPLSRQVPVGVTVP